MRAVIIAAGQGTRLRAVAASKPLAPIAGVPLIEHVVRLARAAGVGAFTVVTGYEAEPLESFLAGLTSRIAVPVDMVRNPEWARPNGLSVLAAAERIDGEALLLMADHLFDPAILRDMLAADRSGRGLTLAADYDVANPLLDLDDATKLAVESDGRIVGVGKALERYNAIDTGLFLVTPALVDALRDSVARGGSGSLSEGVQRLADAGGAYAFDSGGRWWLDVDDEAAFERAQREAARLSLTDI